MKCKLCGATTYTSYRYPLGELPINSVVGLSAHKAQVHPEVVKASRDKTAATRRAKQQEAQDLHERKAAAGLAVSRLVINGYGDVPYEFGSPVVHLMTLDKWDAERARDPEPVAFTRYQNTEALIARLHTQARQHLMEAYQKGQPVPVEDWEKIQAVMEEVAP